MSAPIQEPASAVGIDDDTRVTHRQFMAAAQRRPDGIALLQDGHHLSYAALHRVSNRLTRRLVQHGVAVEEVVAISAARSIDMIVAIVAVLKAGAAYLPLDPTYPRDRLQYMLADAGARLVLVGARQQGVFRDLGVEELAIGQADAADAPERPARPLTRCAAPDTIAYVIYTSGSTGRPKGIMVPHGAVVNHVRWRVATFGLHDQDRLLQRTPLGFDISVWEICGALMTGCTLVLPPAATPQDSADIIEAIVTSEITSLEIVPSILKLLLQDPRIGSCRSLRYVFAGGEALSGTLAARCQAALPATLVNVYGPTEATIWTTAYVVPRGSDLVRVPIGRPVTNTTAIVLDADTVPTPSGPVACGSDGLLFIGGDGLARGYWHRADLTAQSFVPDAYTGAGVPGARVYNTGDLARLRDDGEIEFAGRRDTQIKLRGFRIELDEIEHVLRACPLLADALVAIRKDPAGETKLVAYYVLRTHENSAALNASRHARQHEIREFIASRLPHYMVPHHLRHVDEMPLLPNGKVNMGALPEPAYCAPHDRPVGEGPIEPQNDAERVLAEIWRQVLGLTEVDCNDHFSWYGGDSLQMIEVRLMAQRRGLLIPTSASYHTTLRRLAASAVWTSDRIVSRRTRIREAAELARLYARTKVFEWRDAIRQRRTARIERPDLERFRDFYDALSNKRDIYYLFVRRGLLHWLAKQLEFVPEDVNLVILGTALPQEERAWIAQHVRRPFFHVDLQIDDNAAWEFLFAVNRHHFGWLELGCFVNNSALYRELTRLEDDVACNCVYTHTEKHRTLFMEYLLFINVQAIQALAARQIRVYPSRYNCTGWRRVEHQDAYYRMPRGRDRALMRRILQSARGDAASGGREWLATPTLFSMQFYTAHLFYLHAQQLGFRLKRIRHLTAPSDVTGYHNFFSDELVTALHISHYEQIYTEDKFEKDLERTLQADWLLLQSMWRRLPPAYAARLAEVEAKIRDRGVRLADAPRNVIGHLVHYGVSAHVFDRPQWAFLHGPRVERRPTLVA